jgi:hypothetical protein
MARWLYQMRGHSSFAHALTEEEKKDLEQKIIKNKIRDFKRQEEEDEEEN